VAVGFLMLLAQLGLPGVGRLWPLLLLALGGGLLLLYLSGHGSGGEALLFYGLLGLLMGVFFQLIAWRWIGMARHWPFFLLAPGLGLGAVALVSAGRRGLVLPAATLVGLALMLYLFTSGLIVVLLKLTVRILLPVALVVVGAWFTFGGWPRSRARADSAPGSAGTFPDKLEPAHHARGNGGETTSPTPSTDSPDPATPPA
jgi:hypothetical protein